MGRQPLIAPLMIQIILFTAMITPDHNSQKHCIFANAMDITDETTHENVFHSQDDNDADENHYERSDLEDLDQVPRPGHIDADAMSDKNIQETTNAILQQEQDEHNLVEEMISEEEYMMHMDGDFDHGDDDDMDFEPGSASPHMIQIDGSPFGNLRGGSGPSTMQAMMQDMVQQMQVDQMAMVAMEQAMANSDQDNDSPFEIIDTPMGRLVIQTIPFGDEDDDEHHDGEEEDGIPPEILEMIRVTEAMHANTMAGMMGSSPFGQGPRQLMLQQDKSKDEDDGKPRVEESFDDIMARMNKIGEEIGEKHSQEKIAKLQVKQTSRSMQVLAAVGLFMSIALVSFLLQCFQKKGSKFDIVGDENEGSSYDNSMRRVGKCD